MQLLDVSGPVMDIGGSHLTSSTCSMLQTRHLRPPNATRRLLPTALLYNDAGLELWEQITHLPLYYQTRDEISLLEHYAAQIAYHIAPESILLDIGSGEARKVRPILDELENLQKPVHCLALVLSKPALEKAITELSPRYHSVKCLGLWGTFNDVFAWIQDLQHHHRSFPVWYISLGSFFGNDHLADAVSNLARWQSIMRPQDRMLLGMDAQDDSIAVWHSYHDEDGVFEKFIRNGLRFSNEVLGKPWYVDEDWEVVGHLEDSGPIKHNFLFRARTNVSCEELGLFFSEGDEIDCCEVFKYGPDIMRRQFAAAEMIEIACFKAPAAPFYDYLLRRHELGAHASSTGSLVNGDHPAF